MPNLGITDKFIFTIVSGGVGIAAQTPTIIIQKQSNGYYFNGSGFAPTLVQLNMGEVDALNFPGKYTYDFNQALDTSITNGTETYSIRYENTGAYALTVDEEIVFSVPQYTSYTAQSQPGIEFIKPGFQSPDQTYIITKNNEKRIKATFLDAYAINYDPYELRVKLYDASNRAAIDETVLNGATGTYIKRSSTGNFYMDYTPTNAGDYFIEWLYRDVIGGELFTEQSYLYSLDIQLMGLFPQLRNQIDKAQKDFNTIFGYSDVNLYLYLKGGLSEINRVPPATMLSFVTYPYNIYNQVLIDISTQISLQSQGLLAIDTDSNYSLQGNSFTIDHWAKISTFMSLMNTRINEQLKTMKYAIGLPNAGVKLERGPGFRQVALWQSSPSGISLGNNLGVR